MSVEAGRDQDQVRCIVVEGGQQLLAGRVQSQTDAVPSREAIDVGRKRLHLPREVDGGARPGAAQPHARQEVADPGGLRGLREQPSEHHRANRHHRDLAPRDHVDLDAVLELVGENPGESFTGPGPVEGSGSLADATRHRLLDSGRVDARRGPVGAVAGRLQENRARGGLVEGVEAPQPKISYVKLFPQWNWVIGSGIYIDDVQKEIASLLTVIYAVLAVINVAALAVSWLMARSIAKPIDNIIKSLNTGSDEIASASSQVSSASQSLAEGASEQAAAIEETSASLEEMASMTQQNADNAAQANHLMEDPNQVI